VHVNSFLFFAKLEMFSTMRAFIVVLLSLINQLNTTPPSVERATFLRQMRDFVSQPFDNYKINMRLSMKDEEFDFHKIPGATKHSSAQVISYGSEYKQGDSYTVELKVPLDNVDIQTYYWTGSEAFQVNKFESRTTCKKIEPNKIFISLSSVFTEMDKPEFYDFEKVKVVNGEKMVYWTHPVLPASGWVSLNRPELPLVDLTVHNPEGDYEFSDIHFSSESNVPSDIFAIPAQCDY